MIVAKSHLSLCRWLAHVIYKQAIQIKSGQVNGVLKQGVTGVTAFGSNFTIFIFFLIKIN